MSKAVKEVHYSAIDTPIGKLSLACTNAGLCRVCFGEEDELMTWFEENLPFSIPRRRSAANQKYGRALEGYFSGKLKRFNLDLDLVAVGFRKAALWELAKVPYGTTISYGELAARAGSPRAARAAGTACAHNPIAIVIPCHRVIASDGGIGGFGGRTDIKRFLLRLEGVNI